MADDAPTNRRQLTFLYLLAVDKPLLHKPRLRGGRIAANQKDFLHRTRTGVNALKPIVHLILDAKPCGRLAPAHADAPRDNPAHIGTI